MNKAILKEKEGMMNILNPKKYTSLMADGGSKTIVDKTIAFFEGMGKKRLLEDFDSKAWYQGILLPISQPIAG